MNTDCKTYVDSVEFVTHQCGECFVTFSMTRAFYNKRKEDRKTWYCLNGHPRAFNGPTEAEKLRQELERQRQRFEAESARASRLASERDQVARAHNRMRSRVMNGVCPCCNRTFQNLMRHMKTEHAGEVNLRTLRKAFGMSQSAIAAEVGVNPMHVSLHERGRPIVRYARDALESWVARQSARGSVSAETIEGQE